MNQAATEYLYYQGKGIFELLHIDIYAFVGKP